MHRIVSSFNKIKGVQFNRIDLACFLILLVFSIWAFGINYPNLVLIFIGLIFIFLSFQDLKTKTVSLNWIILLMILSFIQLWIWFNTDTVIYEQAIISALFSAVSTGTLVILSRGKLLGTGDVFILTSAAIISPGIQSIFVYLLFSVLGIIYFGVKKIIKDDDFNKDNRIPLVPFVAIAVVIVQILNNYVNLMLL